MTTKFSNMEVTRELDKVLLEVNKLDLLCYGNQRGLAAPFWEEAV